MLFRSVNLDLKPENIKSVNVGVSAYGFSANFFQNEIKDFVDWYFNPITWVGKYVNKDGVSKFRGVELGYENTFYEKFLVGLNYAYTDAKDSKDVRLVRIPLYKVGVLLGYMPTQELKFSLFGNYIGKRKDSLCERRKE